MSDQNNRKGNQNSREVFHLRHLRRGQTGSATAGLPRSQQQQERQLGLPRSQQQQERQLGLPRSQAAGQPTQVRHQRVVQVQQAATAQQQRDRDEPVESRREFGLPRGASSRTRTSEKRKSEKRKSQKRNSL